MSYVWLQIFCKNTTKIEREKLRNVALNYSSLDVVEPSDDTMKLIKEYVDGNIEIMDVLEIVIEKYRVMGSKNAWSVFNFKYRYTEKKVGYTG